MKNILYLFLFITGILQAQIITVPDANFKSKLLESNTTNSIAYAGGVRVKIDLNLDGQIQQNEALVIDSLNVSSSNIANLSGIQFFLNLKSLRFNSNNVAGSVDLSALIQLRNLNCNYNQISELNITASQNLKTLSAHNNFLTTIDLSQNNLIENLSLGSNNLTELSLNNLALLKSLDCTGNQIETLNCSSNLNLEYLSIQSPILKYLFIKNGADESTTMDSGSWFELFCCSPNLEYVCCDQMQYQSVLQQIELAQLFNCEVNTYCSFTPGGSYNTILGTIVFDENNNGCDTTDSNFSNIRVNINDGSTSGASFTSDAASYLFHTQAGSFDITPNFENPSWFNISPSTATISFPNNDNNITTQNFCLTANGIHPDLEIVIAPVTPARPGFEAVYKIVYKNKGNQTLSQQYGINLFFNQNLMVYSSTTVTPSSAGLGSISWDYENLHPFESREIIIRLLINAPTNENPVNIGDELTFTTVIQPQAGDENTVNNLFIFNQIVVGSFDPNDITCLQGDIVSPAQIGDFLHYNLRFENTGTAPAQNVVVKVDVNPADFDINTLQLMNSTYPVVARIDANKVEFIFDGINLDSGGHGNVLLKLRTKSNLVQGDLVEKIANVYFDYNFPIQTNNAETVFQSLNNPIFEQDNTIKIFPNPTNSFVNISGNFNIKTTELFDTQGRLLQTNIINENTTTLDISAKSNGVYFIKVTSEEGIKVEKIIKQ